jgi:hypothetical protein
MGVPERTPIMVVLLQHGLLVSDSRLSPQESPLHRTLGAHKLASEAPR